MTTKEKFSTSDRNRLTDVQLPLYTMNGGFFWFVHTVYTQDTVSVYQGVYVRPLLDLYGSLEALEIRYPSPPLLQDAVLIIPLSIKLS